MRVDPDVIVFDKIDVDEQLARDIKNKSSARLVIFTNLTDANRYADVAITADIGSQFKNVSFTDDATHTLYYYGPKYWVLRPEFHEYKRRGKVASHSPTRLLLIFGGSDPANITTVVLDNLLGQNRVFHIAVVLGAHFGHNDAIGAILERHVRSGTTVTVHRNVSNVAELMYDADLVLASPGLSVFEALCVGTPVIVMPQDFLQRETYLGFMQMLDRDSVSELEGMIDTGRFTYPSDDHIVRMEIGEGVSELMDVIMHLEKR
jgi:spore coat polysaccharide biosynthesis predicted glycosyltransferase SpsG